MTESLTASVGSGGSEVFAALFINPLPNISFAWATADGANVINPGVWNPTTQSPPLFAQGDGLVQTYGYRLQVHVDNYPAGTAVGISVGALPQAGGGTWNPANIQIWQGATDVGGNAYFGITFPSTPFGAPIPEDSTWTGAAGTGNSAFYNTNLGLGNTLNPIVVFTVYVSGMTVQYAVPVLFKSAQPMIFASNDGTTINAKLNPNSFLDVILVGGGGGGDNPYSNIYNQGSFVIVTSSPVSGSDSTLGMSYGNHLGVSAFGSAIRATGGEGGKAGTSGSGAGAASTSATSYLDNTWALITFSPTGSTGGNSGQQGGFSHTPFSGGAGTAPSNSSYPSNVGAGGDGGVYQSNSGGNMGGAGASAGWIAGRLSYYSRVDPAHPMPPLDVVLTVGSGGRGNTQTNTVGATYLVQPTAGQNGVTQVTNSGSL